MKREALGVRRHGVRSKPGGAVVTPHPSLLTPHLQQRGFTLLELLVVLFIIGITLSFAVLSVGDRTRERSVETEAQRLAARVTLAAQEAVLQAKELALQTTAQGYQFLVLEYTNAGKQAEWRVLNDDEILRPRRLPPGMHLALTPQDGAGAAQTDTNSTQQRADAARVYLLSSGEMTPFEASLSDDDARYLISGTPNGKIAVRNSVHDDETT